MLHKYVTGEDPAVRDDSRVRHGDTTSWTNRKKKAVWAGPRQRQCGNGGLFEAVVQGARRDESGGVPDNACAP